MADAAADGHTKTKNEFVHGGIVWNDYTTPEVIRRCESFQFRPSDICVCTFPRSGTTLTQEIVWEIVNRSVLRKGEKYGDIDERFPFLEFNYKWGGNDSSQFAIDRLEQQESGERLIKTHCPVSYIGQQLSDARPRIVTVARNPKDCCLSLYKFYKGLEMYGPWPGEFPQFLQMFLRGQTMCGDYFQVVADWWQLRQEPNVLFLKYEDIVRRPAEHVTRIAEFLGRSLTEQELDCIVHNCRFDSMYSNDNVNTTFGTGFRFLRKGVVGDWKNQFTVQQSEEMDAAIAERLVPIGLEFEYE